MARIPEDQINRLKQEVSLQRLAEGMGIVLKPCKQELRGLGPFHEDHDPSLFIHSGEKPVSPQGLRGARFAD